MFRALSVDGASIGAGSSGREQGLGNSSDPDAKITKIKDGRPHLAHQAEHVVDLD